MRTMKKIPGPGSTKSLLLTVFILGLTFLWIRDVTAETKPSLAVLPFFVEIEAVCPFCKGVHQRGEIVPGAQHTLTQLLQQKMESLETFRTLPLENVEEAFLHKGRRHFEQRVISSSIELGKELKADFLFVGFLFRFEERVGSSIGAEKPASVAFHLHLFRIRDGVEVWRGRFDETQRPLSENLFKIGSFFRRKASWLTARELSGVGMDELLRKLPGAAELQE